MTDLEPLRLALSRAGRKVYVRNVTTRQREGLARLMMAASIGALSGASLLVDDDGMEQYVHGITPMNATVRVGHAP